MYSLPILQEFDAFLEEQDKGSERLVLEGVDISRVELTRRPYNRLTLVECELGGLDFSGVKLVGLRLVRCTFEMPAMFKRSDLRYANFEGMEFLKGSNFDCSNMQRVILKDVSFNGASLRHADLCHADLRGADVRGADLTGVELKNAKTEGMLSDGAIW